MNNSNDDLISRREAIRIASGFCHPANVAKELAKLPSAQPDLQPTCNQLATDCISRQAAIDAVIKRDANCGIDSAEVLKSLPSAQPEPERTMEEFMYGQDMGNPEDGSL